MKNLIKTLLLITLLLGMVNSAFAAASIYSPANGSQLASPYYGSFYVSTGGYPYYVTTGYNGYGSSDVGYNVPIYSSNFYYPQGLSAHSTVYITLQQGGSYSYYAFSLGSSTPATIYSPANGSTLPSPTTSFYVSSPGYPYYVTTGYNGVGSSDVGYNVPIYSSNFYYPQGLSAHPSAYIRITYGGVSRDYQFVLPSSGVTITSPGNGSTIASPTSYFYTSSTGCYAVTTGYGGVGSSDVGLNVNTCGGSFNFPGGLVGNSGRPTIYIRVTANGVNSDYFFGLPLGSESSSNLNTSLELGPSTYDDNTGGIAPPTPHAVAQFEEGVEALQKVKVVTLTDGSKIEIPRADLLAPINLTWSNSQEGGKYTYNFEFDNKDVYMVRLGDGPIMPTDTVGEAPKGWLFWGLAWTSPEVGADSLPNAKYSITTSFKPGLIVTYIQGQEGRKLVSAATKSSIDNIRLASAASIFENSVRKFAIGPVFAPNVTKEDVLAEVGVWASGYGLSFLNPLLTKEGTVDMLQPQNDLETQIVECLRGVLK